MSTVAQEKLLEYADVIHMAVLKEHKDSHLFTLEDLEQEVWCVLLPYAERLVAESNEGFVYRSAQTAAARFAERERQDNMYFRAAFIYTPDMVRHELERGAWESDPSGDWDMRLDIMDAYEHLEPKEQESLFRRFFLGQPSGTSAQRGVVFRAIEKMTHHLNGAAELSTLDMDSVVELV